MPLLLEKDGYQFYFKKGEPLIPYKKPHVHVRGHGGNIQFFLLLGEAGEIEVKKDNKSMSRSKKAEAKEITFEYREKFLQVWNIIKLGK